MIDDYNQDCDVLLLSSGYVDISAAEYFLYDIVFKYILKYLMSEKGINFIISSEKV